MKYEAKVTGAKELDNTFMRLPRAMQRKAYYPSLRAGGEIVRKRATQNIRAVSEPFSGLARRENTLRVYNLKKFRGNFRVAIQARRGLVNAVKKDKEGKPVRVGMYIAVLEYGSQKLNRKPRPWIRPALKQSEGAVVNAVSNTFNSKMNEVLYDARGKGVI